MTLEKAREDVIKNALVEIKRTQKLDRSDLTELLGEADHIHNKAVFDAINEVLKSRRPYGTNGEPMPW